MLSNKVVIAAPLAIALCATAGLAHGTAMVGVFYLPGARWLAWPELFALPAMIVGVGAGVVAYFNAPKKPPGWRSAHPWSFARLAPAAIYFSLVTASLALYPFVDAPTADLIHKVVFGTGSAFAFALLSWENLWQWRQWAEPQASC